MRICVIGAGPAGLAAALYLGEEHEVTIFERQEDVKPTPCGGGIDEQSLAKLWAEAGVDSRAAIVAEIEELRIVFPRSQLSLEVRGFVVDREKWQSIMLRRVEEKCEVNLGVHVTPKLLEEFSKAYDVVLGCDGPASVVRAKIGAKYERVFLTLSSPTKSRSKRLEFYVDRRLSSGGFGWVFPGSVGVGELKEHSAGFWARASRFLAAHGAEGEAERWVIPYKAPRLAQEKFYLFGDAAGMVCCLTGGGLQPILSLAPELKKLLGDPRLYEETIRKASFFDPVLERAYETALTFSQRDLEALKTARLLLRPRLLLKFLRVRRGLLRAAEVGW